MQTKFIPVILLVFAFGACQSDEGDPVTEQAPSDDPMQEQFPQQQPASPEIEVSDDELMKFVEVSSVAQEVQMESQTEMVGVVEDEGLDVDTYNQIAEAQQSGQSDEELDVSAEDQEKFDRATEAIAEIGQEMEGKMATAIEEEGMEMARFMEINMALQQDQNLQQRIQQLMMEAQPQAQPADPEGF